MNAGLEADCVLILDTFSGADGGGSYVRFQALIRDLDEENSPAAREILELVSRFARLIRAASERQRESL